MLSDLYLVLLKDWQERQASLFFQFHVLLHLLLLKLRFINFFAADISSDCAVQLLVVAVEAVPCSPDFQQFQVLVPVPVPVWRDPLEVRVAVPWLQLLLVPYCPDFQALALIAKMSVLVLRVPSEVRVAVAGFVGQR